MSEKKMKTEERMGERGRERRETEVKGSLVLVVLVVC